MCDDEIHFEKLKHYAIVPTKNSTNEFNLMSAYDYQILKRNFCNVKTEIKPKIPASFYFEIKEVPNFSRQYDSGIINWLLNLDENGGIDIKMMNYSSARNLKILKGDVVARLVCKEYPIPMEVD